jgi:hypothetical protein
MQLEKSQTDISMRVRNNTSADRAYCLCPASGALMRCPNLCKELAPQIEPYFKASQQKSDVAFIPTEGKTALNQTRKRGVGALSEAPRICVSLFTIPILHLT